MMNESGGEGAAENADSGEKPWEKASTIEMMQKEAPKWTLASDAGMLLYLQEFSQRMMSRTHDIQEEMNGLVYEAKLTGVRAQNTFNDFIMLANTQFVENRVYDEDVSQEDTSGQETEERKEKTKGEREAELIPQISEAMLHGMAVIDTYFNKLDVNEANSESEEDDSADKGESIFEAKDPYIGRPLPYIIGTTAFLQDDDVGIVDISSDEESESDHGSISESESESESSDEDEIEDKRRKALMNNRKSPVMFTDSDTGSESGNGLFCDDKSNDGEVSESESSEDGSDSNTGGPSDLANELAKKIGADRKTHNDIVPEKHKAPSKKKKTSETERRPTIEKTDADQDVFFGGSLTNEDNFDYADSPFEKKDGLFSGGGGLFDDDEEEDLFEETVRKDRRKSDLSKTTREEHNQEHVNPPVDASSKKDKRKVPVGGVSIFGEEAGDIFGRSLSREDNDDITEAANQKPNKPRGNSKTNLFDDDEEDLFSSFSSNKQNNKPEIQQNSSGKKTLGRSLFDSEEEDDGDAFVEKTTSSVKIEQKHEDEKPKKKLPAGAVSLFGSAPNSITTAVKAQRKRHDSSEDEEDEESWSDEEDGPHQTAGSKLATAVESIKRQEIHKEPSPSPSSNSLFAEEPEDLFSSVTSKSSTTSKPKTKTAPAGLFGGEEDDDLFSASTKSTARKAQKGATISKSKKASFLFDDDDDEESQDIFSAVSTPKDSKKIKPTTGDAIFEEDDLFTTSKTSDQTSITKAKESGAKAVTSRAKPLSLFDDEPPSSDIFFDKPSGDTERKQSTGDTAGVPKPRTKSKSLFEDEDVLFSSQEDDPTVDLFGAHSPLRTSPPELVTPTPSPQKPKAKPVKSPLGAARTSVSDDGDDDLFSNASKKNVQKTTPKPSSLSVAGVTTSESSSDLFVNQDNQSRKQNTTNQPEPSSPGKKPTGKLPKDARGTRKASGSEREEADLFGNTTKTTQKKSDLSSEVVKPKKPAGAVSMFGGLDPSAIVKRSKQDRPGDGEEYPPLSDATTDRQTDNNVLRTEANSVSGADIQDGAWLSTPEDTSTSKRPKGFPAQPTLPEPAVPTTRPQRSHPKPSSSVGRLQANLAINPEVLLPGAAPPVREAEPVAASFDEPAQAQTLPSFAKDKAKIRVKKRPPSRKPRLASAGQSDNNVGDSSKLSPPSTDVTASFPVFRNETDVPSNTRTKDVVRHREIPPFVKDPPIANDTRARKDKSSSEIDDFFSDTRDDDLFTNRKSKRRLDTKPVDIFVDTENDIFGASKTSNVGEQPDFFPRTDYSAADVHKQNVDIAGKNVKSKTADQRDIFATSSGTRKKNSGPPVSDHTTTKTAHVNEDDDIFADLSKTDRSSTKTTDRSGRTSSSHSDGTEKLDAKGNSVDDIFSDRTLPVRAEKTTKKQFDEIFGDSVLPSEDSQPIVNRQDNDTGIYKRNKAFAKRKVSPPHDGIFADPGRSHQKNIIENTNVEPDHINDIFGDSSKKYSKQSTDQTTTATVATDDIFTAVPSKTTNISSTKPNDTEDVFSDFTAKTSKSSTEKTMADDDDIFSNFSSKSSKKTTEKTKVLADDTDDIFSNSTSKNSKTSVKNTKTLEDDKDDIFKNVTGKSTTTSTAKVKVKEEETDDIFSNFSSKTSKKKVDDSDDIFGDVTKTTGKHSTKTPAMADQDEDLFKASTNTASKKPKKIVTADDDLFHDETDIFADLPSRKRKQKSAKSAATDKPLFASNVDDIFADSSVRTKPKKAEPKKKSNQSAAAKAASIFDENTPNIFDDPLNALSK